MHLEASDGDGPWHMSRCSVRPHSANSRGPPMPFAHARDRLLDTLRALPGLPRISACRHVRARTTSPSPAPYKRASMQSTHPHSTPRHYQRHYGHEGVLARRGRKGKLPTACQRPAVLRPVARSLLHRSPHISPANISTTRMATCGSSSTRWCTTCPSSRRCTRAACRC